MSRIDKLIAKLCPNGVEFKGIGEIADCYGGATPASGVPAYWENGTIPWMSSGEVNKRTVNDTDQKITQAAYDSCSTKMVPPNAVVIALAGQGKTRGMAARTRLALCTNQSLCSVVCKESMSSDFLYHYLQTQYQELRSVSSGAGARGGLNLQMIRVYRVPVPPLEIQRKIVKVLDVFMELEAELEAELKAELKARRKQYKHCRDSLLTFDAIRERETVRWATLGEIGQICMCKRIFKHETAPEGDIPFYKIGTFGGTPDAHIPRKLYEDYRERYSFPKKGDILLSAAGTIGRAIPYDGNPAYFQDSNIVWIDNDESLITNKFLFHWYQIVEWTTDSGTIKRLYNENIRRTKLPIPPLAEQARIVAILDKFDALTNDLSEGLPAEITARRQQYEHYRDRLLTFQEAA